MPKKEKRDFVVQSISFDRIDHEMMVKYAKKEGFGLAAVIRNLTKKKLREEYGEDYESRVA